MQSNVSIGANVLYAGSCKNVSRYPRDFKVCCKLSSGARFQSGNGFFLLRAALRELHNSVQTCWASWKRIWLPFCLCKLLSKLVRDPPAKNNMRSDPKQGARREHMWSKVWEASVRLPKSQSLAAKSLASVQKYFHSGASVSISNVTILRKLPETHAYFRKSKIGTWGASNGSVWQRILSLGQGTSRSPRKPFFTPTSGFLWLSKAINLRVVCLSLSYHWRKHLHIQLWPFQSTRSVNICIIKLRPDMTRGWK